MPTIFEDSFLLLDDGGLFLLDDGGYWIVDQQPAEVGGGGQHWRTIPKPFFFLDEILQDDEEVFVLSEIE